ncbi:MAG: hypothetical protein HY985_13675 [Magnetospirillum sp.]|nr:hypothetical protein [Magnetospirillum sp.]
MEDDTYGDVTDMGGDSDINSDPDDSPPDFHDMDDEADDLHVDPAQEAARADVVFHMDELLQENANRPDPVIQMRQMPRGGAAADDYVINVDQGDPQQVQQMAQLNGQMAALRQQVQAIQEGLAAPGILNKFATVFVNAVGFASSVATLYFALKSVAFGDDGSAVSAPGQPSIQDGPNADCAGTVGAQDPLPPANSPTAQALYQTWLKESDTAFWENAATFVDLNKPRCYQEQVMFMQYTVDIANGAMKTTPGNWATPADKLKLVASLTDTIHGPGLSSALRSLPTLSNASQPVPRAVAAELMSLALTQWWAKYG